MACQCCKHGLWHQMLIVLLGACVRSGTGKTLSLICSALQWLEDYREQQALPASPGALSWFPKLQGSLLRLLELSRVRKQGVQLEDYRQQHAVCHHEVLVSVFSKS